MLEDDDIDNGDRHQMSLSGDEAQHSDENERKSGDENEGDKKDEESGRRVDPKTSVKRVVRNPQPKLNAQRLKGSKGIHTIENYFEGFKFYGKGHEKRDLDRVMKRLEHWAHRLFPKYRFDDFLEKVEVVGHKKELQNFLFKYRNDQNLGDGIIDPNDDDGDDDDAQRGNSPEPIDEFDMLIAEQIERSKQATHIQAAHKRNDEIFDNLLGSGSQRHTNQQSSSQTTSEHGHFVNAPSTSSSINAPSTSRIINAPSTSSTTTVVMNKPTAIAVAESEEEITKRIERNRLLAIERRLARFKQIESQNRKEAESQEAIRPVESSQSESICSLQTSNGLKVQSQSVGNEDVVMKRTNDVQSVGSEDVVIKRTDGVHSMVVDAVDDQSKNDNYDGNESDKDLVQNKFKDVNSMIVDVSNDQEADQGAVKKDINSLIIDVSDDHNVYKEQEVNEDSSKKNIHGPDINVSVAVTSNQQVELEINNKVDVIDDNNKDLMDVDDSAKENIDNNIKKNNRSKELIDEELDKEINSGDHL